MHRLTQEEMDKTQAVAKKVKEILKKELPGGVESKFSIGNERFSRASQAYLWVDLYASVKELEERVLEQEDLPTAAKGIALVTLDHLRMILSRPVEAGMLEQVSAKYDPNFQSNEDNALDTLAGHNCDECDKKGACPIEPLARAAKKSRDEEAEA